MIPTGKRPLARIIHRVVTEREVLLDNLRSVMHGRADMICPPGTYAVLHTRTDRVEPWTLMMSDTPYEMRAGGPFMYHAHGRVLVIGLGLGTTTLPVLAKPEVEHVTIIEKNPDVLRLVGPHLPHEKLTLIEADGFTWWPRPDVRFNTIWLDIWPESTPDILPEIAKLKRRFTHRLDRSDPECWMSAWEEGVLRYNQRREREGTW